MDAPNLLLADSNEEFRQALTAALGEHYQVRSCADGKEALSLLRQFRPEVLVLDLMLPELDGISLLQTASREGLRPKVLATTALVSPYVLEAVDHLGIGYLIRKPCDAQATAQRVGDLNRSFHSPAPVSDPHAVISEALLSLGITPKHRGYHYLREGIVLMAQDPSQSVTKVLYPQVGEKCDADPRHVERSIRSALSAAWEHRDEALWQAYFPVHQDRCPTNAVFLSRLAELLR